MTVVSIHQPNYLPTLGYFRKMAMADVFVIVTNLQFEKLEGWQRRNRIPGGDGKDLWLTVPVLGSRTQMIRDVLINNAEDWAHRHFRTLEHRYRSALNSEVMQKLRAVYEHPWTRLADLSIACINILREALEITTPVVIDEETTGRKYELILKTCQKHGGDTYLSGLGAKAYTSDEDIALLRQEGITHRYIEDDGQASFPYSSVHYLLADPEAAKKVISRTQSALASEALLAR